MNQLKLYIQNLSAEELSEKLKKAADAPRKFTAAEREELLNEAARRIDSYDRAQR